MEEIKRCGNCGRFLGESSFYCRKNGNYNSECKKCTSVVRFIYYRNNKERIKRQHGQWHKDNRESANKRSRQWYKDNIEYNKQYKKQYLQNNRNEIYAKNAKRRAIKLKLSPELTREEQHRVLILRKWQQELPGKWHLDHVIPLYKGGLHHPDNLQLIPAKQNLEKHDKNPEEFYGRFNEFLTN